LPTVFSGAETIKIRNNTCTHRIVMDAPNKCLEISVFLAGNRLESVLKKGIVHI
jgi:hypothetical protein